MPRRYYVYILTNRSGTLYVGVTNNLQCRIIERREGRSDSFTRRYSIGRLVYFDVFDDVRVALAREKQIKGWARRRKIALVNSANPTWSELAPESDGSTDAR